MSDLRSTFSELSEFDKGRAYQNELCIPKLKERDVLFLAMRQIATIKDRIPFDAGDAATECIRLAKQALREIGIEKI